MEKPSLSCTLNSQRSIRELPGQISLDAGRRRRLDASTARIFVYAANMINSKPARFVPRSPVVFGGGNGKIKATLTWPLPSRSPQTPIATLLPL